MIIKNTEIAAIITSYTQQKAAAQKARAEGKEAHELKLPASVAWKRRCNLDKLFKAKAVIDEALREIQQKYSDDEHSTKSEGDSRQVKAKYILDFVKEQEEILAQDTEVKIRTIAPEELDGMELTDADMDTLAFMISEGGE